VTVQQVLSIRDRVLPMLRHVAEEYKTRVPAGYPQILDSPEQGLVGISLDPSYSLYIVSDGDQLFAEFNFRSPRNDARSSAGREKFSGAPIRDRRPLSSAVSDQGLRNLISELMSRWNFQPMIIHITDTD
jgi:hypothetical protein